MVIVSSKFDWAIPDSLAWLADHGVPAREVHFLWDKTLAGCDVYLDDAPHQLEELTAGLPDAIVCRMVHPWNDPMPGVVDVHSWAEFEAVVERVAAERGQRSDSSLDAGSHGHHRRQIACVRNYLVGYSVLSSQEPPMPAITVDDITVLPRIPAPDPVTARPRTVKSVTRAPSAFEGEGFPVRRAFAGVDLATSTRSSTSTRWARSSTRRASPRARPGTRTVASRPSPT